MVKVIPSQSKDLKKQSLSSKISTNLTSAIVNNQVKKTNSNSSQSKFILADGNPFEKMVSDEELKSIEKDLIANHGDLVNSAFDSKEARTELEEIIRKEYRFKDNTHGRKKARYIVSETVGLSFIDRILEDPNVNDIGWNGSFLSVESNERIQFFTSDQLGLADSEKKIFNIVSKVANSMQKTFNRQFPILDSVSGNIRMNAIHQSVSPAGSTFSIRVIKAKMALTDNNFFDFAPTFISDFFNVIMKTGSSILIGGETGSGKTELIKYLCSKASVADIMFVIEDVPEMKLKDLLPTHNIYSVVSSGTASLTDLTRASMRNYPDWVLPSEIRGSDANEVIDTVVNGHNLISSLHVPNCRAMPKRMVRLASQKRAINEKAVEEDVLSYFNFGIHIKTAKIETDSENMIFHKVRYISEIVEFSVDNTTTLFKQDFINGEFFVTTAQLSDEYKDRMKSSFLDFDFPEMDHQRIEKSKQLTKVIEESRNLLIEEVV